MARTKNRYVIVGLGQFGFSVAQALVEAGEDVVAMDVDEDRVQEVSTVIPKVVAASGSDERALKALGIEPEDVAIISVGQKLEASILSTTVMLNMGLTNVIAKANNNLHGMILEKVGATRVIYPEREMAERLADSLINPDVLEHIRIAEDHSIIEVSIPSFLVGETLVSSNLRATFGINVLAIHSPRNAEKQEKAKASGANANKKKNPKKSAFLISPPPDYNFQEGDILVVFGKDSQIEAFKRHMEKKAE